jgi:hypothetical protein
MSTRWSGRGRTFAEESLTGRLQYHLPSSMLLTSHGTSYVRTGRFRPIGTNSGSNLRFKLFPLPIRLSRLPGSVK